MQKFLSTTLLLLLLSGAAHAQKTYATAPVLGAALSRSIATELARNELEQAGAALARLKQDPLALRADLQTASDRLVQAQAGDLAAQLALRLTVTQELGALGAAENDLRVSQGKLELAQMTLQGVRVKVSAGTANRLELEKAQTDLQNAQTETAQAGALLEDTRAKVRGRLGQLPSAALAAPPKPSLGSLQAALSRHPRQLKADAAVTVAARELAVKSSDLSSQSDIKNAQNALAAAKKSAEDTARSLRLELGDAWQRYQTALTTLQSRERSAVQSAENARLQQQRFAGGVISKQAALQAANDAAAAAAAQSAARSALEAALVSVAISANLNVWAGGQ